jgi:chitinase
LIQGYDMPGCDSWSGVTLNPDGTSFWTNGCGGLVEFDITSGAVLRTLPIGGAEVAVYGGYRAAQDRTAPVASVVSPANGATFPIASNVVASYSCSDAGGSDLVSCNGTVPTGSAIDTSSTGKKTFAVTALDGAGNKTTTSTSYTVVHPSISIENTSAAEGAPMTLNVSLSSPSPLPVSVRYTTANSLARAGVDYVQATGTLTFAPGETLRTITVMTIADTLFELEENLAVRLTRPTNATLSDAQASATITNDDPKPSVTVTDVSRLEGSAGTSALLVFTVSLSTVSGTASKVHFATANQTATTSGRDYGAKSGTLTIALGKTTGTISVTIRGDAVVEPDETFELRLSSPIHVTLDDLEAVGTILNDD